MYSTKEAAEKLGLSEAHVRRLLEQGKISGQLIGRTWVILQLDYKRRRRPKRKRREEEKP